MMICLNPAYRNFAQEVFIIGSTLSFLRTPPYAPLDVYRESCGSKGAFCINIQCDQMLEWKVAKLFPKANKKVVKASFYIKRD